MDTSWERLVLAACCKCFVNTGPFLLCCLSLTLQKSPGELLPSSVCPEALCSLGWGCCHLGIYGSA